MPAQRPEELRDAVESNLKALDTERLAAVNLRLMDAHQQPAGAEVPLEDQLAEMVSLREEGKIAGVGISTAGRAQVEQAIAQAGIICVQNAFSLLDQGDADVLDLCHDRGIAYVPYFPLGSAFPHLPKVTDAPAVRAPTPTMRTAILLGGCIFFRRRPTMGAATNMQMPVTNIVSPICSEL